RWPRRSRRLRQSSGATSLTSYWPRRRSGPRRKCRTRSASSSLRGLCSNTVCCRRPRSSLSTRWCTPLPTACCSRRQRRTLHARIACTLEEDFRNLEEARPEILAHHLTEAGFFEKAIGYWRRAGGQSVARSGFVEAITQLRTGLRLITNLMDTRERKQQELERQITLAGALTVVKGYAHPEVAAAFGRAHSLIGETGRAGTVVHFSMLRGLWAADFVSGKPKAALDHAHEFLSLALSQEDSWGLAT